MPAPGEDRFFAELRACTAELARIIDGDLERPVPTCPGWTFRQLATRLGRGHRWAAQIVATRATGPVQMREVADGKLPADPARHADWLNAGAGQVFEAVTAAGSNPVWTFTGIRPASFWARRRAHEAAVHLADAQLAAGRDVDLTPEVAADGVDERLTIIAAGTQGATGPARAQAQELRGDGQSLHFHSTDPGTVRHRRVAGHPYTIRRHHPARPRPSRRRRPRTRSQPAARRDPPAAALRSRHRSPRRARTAQPLAPAHAILTGLRIQANRPAAAQSCVRWTGTRALPSCRPGAGGAIILRMPDDAVSWPEVAARLAAARSSTCRTPTLISTSSMPSGRNRR